MTAGLKIDLLMKVKHMTALEMFAAAPPQADGSQKVTVIMVIRTPWGYETCWE